MTIILGSQSPRRKEIMNFFTLPFQQVVPSFDEESIPFQNNPHEYVKILSKGKAQSLQSRYPSDLILTADTIVYRDGKIFGKPKDKEEAFINLKELAGNWHSVFTGITIYHQGKALQDVEETRVQFHPLNDEQIHLYQDNLHCADKAGGYMIQGAGSLIVSRIEGCYYNVMGLPVNTLVRLFAQIGIDLWRHLKG